MAQKKDPHLVSGRVYRTQDLEKMSRNTNPTRLARRLVDEGKLVRLRRGIYAAPEPSRFGNVPPRDEELLRRFLKSDAFVFTGPDRWNALGLGTTQTFATTLVYNKKRTGTFELDGRKFELRRVAFPPKPTAEWYAVDLLKNAPKVGTSLPDLEAALGRAVSRGTLAADRLRTAAKRYGTLRTQTAVDTALAT